MFPGLGWENNKNFGSETSYQISKYQRVKGVGLLNEFIANWAKKQINENKKIKQSIINLLEIERF